MAYPKDELFEPREQRRPPVAQSAPRFAGVLLIQVFRAKLRQILEVLRRKVYRHHVVREKAVCRVKHIRHSLWVVGFVICG